MSQSEAAGSGDVACLNELVRFVIRYGTAEKLLREHKPDDAGHCRRCRSLGCTLYVAAQEATRHMAARMLRGSAA